MSRLMFKRIQYPTQWTASRGNIPLCSFVTACFVSEQGGILTIVEEDLATIGMGQITLEEYVDIIISNAEGSELQSREQVSNSQGLPIEIVELTFQRGLFNVKQLIYVHEGNTGFIATCLIPKARYDELEPLIDYSLGTFGDGELG